MIGAVDQLVAPQGYGVLQQETVYHVLRSVKRRDRMLAVSFFTKKAKLSKAAMAAGCYRLDFLRRESYEDGLLGKRLRPLAQNELVHLPPWNQKYHGLDFDSDPRFVEPIGDSEESLADKVDRRVVRLAPVVEQMADILAADSPEAVLNSIARTFGPPNTQNEPRYRLWAMLYMAFRGNRWSLLPAFHLGGEWDRYRPDAVYDKAGRNSRHGTHHGSRMDGETCSRMKEAFDRYARKGRFLTEVYEECMHRAFHCVIERNDCGRPIPRSKDGRPVPSYDQFRHHLYRLKGKQEVQRRLLGDQSHRLKNVAPEGSYSEGATDVFEVAYWDCAYTSEHPRGFTEDHELPKLPIVEIVDGAIGLITGIGATVGSESASTYNAALFCEAIPKSKFGEIIGYPIDDEEWPNQGRIQLEPIGDRGASRGKQVRTPLKRHRAAYAAVPSYTPQSNAPAESRHLRRRRTTGAPTYRKSHLNPVGLFRRAVQTAMARNRSSSALARATPEMIAAGVKTPLDAYKFMASRGRLTGIPITFDQAVRDFLPKVKFKVDAGHLVLHGVRYRSRQLLRNELWRLKARSWQGHDLTGYVLEIATRKAWVELGGHLVEVDAVIPIHGGSTVRLSLPELMEQEKQRKRLDGEVRHDRRLENIHAMNEYTEKTGERWHGGRTKRGSAKSTKAAAKDVAALKAH